MKLYPFPLSLLILSFPLVWWVNEIEQEINLRAKHGKHIHGDSLQSTKLSRTLTLLASIHLKISAGFYIKVFHGWRLQHRSGMNYGERLPNLRETSCFFFSFLEWLQATRSLQGGVTIRTHRNKNLLSILISDLVWSRSSKEDSWVCIELSGLRSYQSLAPTMNNSLKLGGKHLQFLYVDFFSEEWSKGICLEKTFAVGLPASRWDLKIPQSYRSSSDHREQFPLEEIEASDIVSHCCPCFPPPQNPQNPYEIPNSELATKLSRPPQVVERTNNPA